MIFPENTALAARRLAARLGVKTATVAAWRRRGRGPKGWYFVSKTCVVYPLESVLEWEAERKASRPKFGTPPAHPRTTPDAAGEG